MMADNNISNSSNDSFNGSKTPLNHINPSPIGGGASEATPRGGEALNPAQLSAVTYCDGPQLVIAGAGSGKTRVLTYKIAYLLEHYLMKPWNILALTFTNKAADEMKERIATIVGQARAQYLQMGTFHSIFARILRYEAKTIGFGSDFTIYDETDSRSLIKNIVKQMGLDDKTYKPATVHSAISMAKNRLQSPDDYAMDADMKNRDFRRNMPETYKIFMAYQQRLRQANAMDFDDLLVMTFRLLNEHEDIRQKYASRFLYVLVDEYQDTNFAQQQIVNLLTKENQHVCVVGDDYQSIYAFRGANIANILHFSEIYPTAKLFKLEQNYRSTQNIVAAANSLMKHNHKQIDKDVYSKNAEGEKVTVYETASDKTEATVVCREIKRLMQKEGLHYKDFAILYRTNAQSRTFEDEMRKTEVGMAANYRIYGGLSFYQRKEIKDIIAYFRLVVNPNDEEAFRRIINYPARGIGNTTIAKIVQTAQTAGVSLWETICHPAENGLNVNRGTIAKLDGFRALIEKFIAERDTKDALTLGKEIIKDSGIEKDLATDKTPEGDARRENVDELVSGIASFVNEHQPQTASPQPSMASPQPSPNGEGDADTSQGATGALAPSPSERAGERPAVERPLLSSYLQTVSLASDLDSSDDSDDKITLMTIHSAKGLEFNTVFVVGLEQNIFPSMMSMNEDNELEEERRLLYVAITRAEKHCFLTWAHERWRYGKLERYDVSQFIGDIDPKYLDFKSSGKSYSSNSGFGSRYNSWGGGFDDEPSTRGSRPWDEDYEIEKPYTGYHAWGDGYQRRSNRMQNSRPVAGQFMADPKPKITSPKKPEAAVNPFSASFEQKLKQGGNWSRVSRAMSNGGRHTAESNQTAQSSKLKAQSGSKSQSLREGAVIEHSRFGRGTVVKVEGTGENAKATVDFDNTGRKQLLLKFAKFNIIG